MIKFDFNFLDRIEPNLKQYLDIAQNSIITDPHNTMAKVRACMEFIVVDILKKSPEALEKSKKGKSTDKLSKRLNSLKICGILDEKSKSACDVVRYACNEAVHSLESDSEWAQLCLNHMNIFCEWYAKKYYNIQNNNKSVVINYNGPRKEYTAIITLEEAKEAYKYLSINVNSKDDMLLILASANLLNAYVKQKDYVEFMKYKYIFKNILVNKLEEAIKKRIEGIDIYVTKDLTYAKVHDLQFSFHYLKLNDFMHKYMNSSFNKVQTWSGVRLQPCASIVFNRAKQYVDIEGEEIC